MPLKMQHDFLRDFYQQYPSIDLTGQAILITGGTGSFGSKMARHLLDFHRPKRIVIFSRDEWKQSEMSEALSPHRNASILRFFIGDVRDAQRLDMAMRDIDYVIHTAAQKQVVASEYNPFECIKTNVMGAENLVNGAIANRVKKVIALSTDKAANPVNIYGASKLAADKIIAAANNLSGASQTKFSVVRYGNVINSRGSVIPLFRKLLKNNPASLPITDARMTRFWITLDQGIAFVLSSMNIMFGGEIFVPKIPSMRITDMAEAMAPNIKLDVVGIRPGEKLHEIMVPVDDARQTIDIGDRYLIEPSFPLWASKEDMDNAVYRKNQKAVDEDFCYSSDRNEEWMSIDMLKAILQK